MTQRQVRIFRPTKQATQSGRAKLQQWVMECELETKRHPEPLMGWIASGDTMNQPRMVFDTAEEAVAFAEKNGWEYTIVMPKQRTLKGRSYLDNFKAPTPSVAKE